MAPPIPFSVTNILGKGPTDPRLEELFLLDKQIGKGAFGVVRLARNKATAEPVAVKSISKAKLVCKEDVKDVQAEVAIMNLVAGHINVVTLQVRCACSVRPSYTCCCKVTASMLA
jgi:calcium-dependent protein kinase